MAAGTLSPFSGSDGVSVRPGPPGCSGPHPAGGHKRSCPGLCRCWRGPLFSAPVGATWDPGPRATLMCEKAVNSLPQWLDIPCPQQPRMRALGAEQLDFQDLGLF